MDEVVPIRYESVIDPDTYTALLQRAYNSNGVLIFMVQGWHPVRDLPPEDYAVPKQLTRVRPKSFEEAKRLDSQIPAGQ